MSCVVNWTVDRATFLAIDAAVSSSSAGDDFSTHLVEWLRGCVLREWIAAGSPSVDGAPKRRPQRRAAASLDEVAQPPRRRGTRGYAKWWAGYAARSESSDRRMHRIEEAECSIKLKLPPAAAAAAAQAVTAPEKEHAVTLRVRVDPARADAWPAAAWGMRVATSLRKWHAKGLLRVPPSRDWPARATVCKAWSRRMVSLAHGLEAAQHTNAYISTMGGGYFMCKRIGEARKMALLQAKVAAMSGDTQSLSTTAIHLIYNTIALGDFDEAEAAIGAATRAVEAEAQRSSSKRVGVHESMLRGASYYLAQLRAVHARDPLLLAAGSAAVPPVQDELYRQRFARE